MVTEAITTARAAGAVGKILVPRTATAQWSAPAPPRSDRSTQPKSWTDPQDDLARSPLTPTITRTGREPSGSTDRGFAPSTPPGRRLPPPRLGGGGRPRRRPARHARRRGSGRAPEPPFRGPQPGDSRGRRPNRPIRPPRVPHSVGFACAPGPSGSDRLDTVGFPRVPRSRASAGTRPRPRPRRTDRHGDPAPCHGPRRCRASPRESRHRLARADLDWDAGSQGSSGPPPGARSEARADPPEPPRRRSPHSS